MFRLPLSSFVVYALKPEWASLCSDKALDQGQQTMVCRLHAALKKASSAPNVNINNNMLLICTFLYIITELFMEMGVLESH